MVDMKTIEDMASEIHARTGLTGKELEQATLLVAARMAKTLNLPEAAKHFTRRLKETTEADS